ncbi:MAG: SgcJ/EcaC family oxidoreductase [bacterium]
MDENFGEETIVKLTPVEERAIRETVREVEATWNRHDMEAYASLLTEDADWVNIVGMWWRGKADVYKAHKAFHQTIFRNVSLHFDQVEVRGLAQDVAVAVCTLRQDGFTTPTGNVRPESQARLSLILRKTGERWLICHAHNTTIDMEAAKSNPIRS